MKDDYKDEIEHVDAPIVPVVAAGDQKVDGKAHNVANAELYAAVKESPIDWKSKASMHLFYSMFMAFICDCANGYDGSLMTAILAMPHFQARFNAGANLNTSVIFSLYTVGSMVGSPVGAAISDKLGRKKAMLIGASIIIMGAAIISSSFQVPQIVVGRFILGFGVVIMMIAAPSYVQEVAPPQWRGRCVGLYNLGWFGGSIPAAGITYGCQFIDSDWSWRIPLMLQCTACLIVLTNVWFIPESPRYHMMNGREDLALEFLVKYHGNGNPQSKLVQLEFAEWKEGIRQDGIDKRWWDYAPLLKTHSNRWRMIQVAMISIIPTFSSGGMGYYTTLLYKNVGISSPAELLMVNLVSSIVSWLVAMCAALCTDWLPRRKAVTIGTFGCACMLAVNAALTSKVNGAVVSGGNVSQSFSRGAVAAMFLYGVFFSFGFTPLQAVMPTEALESTTRAKGLAFSGFSLSAVNFVNQFAAPVGLNNMGYKYIWIWVGVDFFFVLVWYFFCVESKGRTLEELAYIYDQPNPVKASLQKEKVVVQNNGTVVQVVDD